MKSYQELEIIENKKIEEKERLKRRKNRKNVKKVDIKVLLKGKTIRKTKTEKYTALKTFIREGEWLGGGKVRTKFLRIFMI